MTNSEILTNARKEAGIAEGVKIDTFIGWKTKGYSVKKGEKMAFSAKIWIPKHPEKKKEEMTLEDYLKPAPNCFLKNCVYFTEFQVQEITPATVFADDFEEGKSFKSLNKSMKKLTK